MTTNASRTITEAEAVVAVAIKETVLPAAYTAIDDLLDVIGEANVPKELLIRCKKLLPAWAPHSFENSVKKGN